MILEAVNWKDFCEPYLQEKFKSDGYIPIVSNTQEDWGIDGYTKTGILFLCYTPKENLIANLYEELVNKINESLKKIEIYEKEIEILLNGIKIKQWILLTKKLPNKEIVIFSIQKANEYLKKNLIILDEKFEIEVQPISYIESYIKKDNLKISYSNKEIKYKEEINFDSDHSNYIDNLVKKLRVLCENKETHMEILKKTYILNYSKGIEICKNLERDYPEIFASFIEFKENFEANIPEKLILLDNNTRSNKEIFGILKEKIREKLSENFSSKLDNNLLDSLASYCAALWLLECPINFEYN